MLRLVLAYLGCGTHLAFWLLAHFIWITFAVGVEGNLDEKAGGREERNEQIDASVANHGTTKAKQKEKRKKELLFTNKRQFKPTLPGRSRLGDAESRAGRRNRPVPLENPFLQAVSACSSM